MAKCSNHNLKINKKNKDTRTSLNWRNFFSAKTFISEIIDILLELKVNEIIKLYLSSFTKSTK